MRKLTDVVFAIANLALLVRIRDFHAATTDAKSPRTHTRYSSSIRSFLVLCVGIVLLQTACLSSAAQQSTGGTPHAPSPSAAIHASIAAGYGKLPMSFEANQGQTDPQVRFLSRGSGYSLFLTDRAAVLSLRKPITRRVSTPDFPSRLKPKQPVTFKTDVVRMELWGASRGLRVTGDSQLPGTANYFIGNDPSKWHSAVPTYARVKYDQVYPGVDLVYYGNQSQLEYDFVVAPNADPRPIKLHFVGAKKLKLDKLGGLEVIAKNGQIAFHKPVVYQQIAGKRREIEGRYSLLAQNTIAFTLGTYDHDREVVIDPTLAYSTYIGGSETYEPAIFEFAPPLAIDSAGNAYITGTTLSNDYPFTAGAFQTVNHAYANGGSNVVVTKLNPSGTGLVYSTYLGGSLADVAGGIAVDPSGNAYLVGSAGSTDFPITSGAFQTKNLSAGNGSNAFVTKLSPSGTALDYSTFLGGSNVDLGVSIDVDASGSAYVAGQATSTNFPSTSGAFQTMNVNQSSGFISKLNPSGSELVYSTFIPGVSLGPSLSIKVDGNGNAYLAGAAGATDFPVTPGAFQTVDHAVNDSRQNGFILKMNPTGTGLGYATYLGGSVQTIIHGLAIDQTGHAYVTGLTDDADFPVTPGAYEAKESSMASAFVSKIAPDGGSLDYSTYLGGTDGTNTNSYGLGITVDASGDAYVVGLTSEPDFPTTSDALQKSNNAAKNNTTNGFLTEFSPAGTGLIYSSYFGGSGDITTSQGTMGDVATGVAVDGSGNIYINGYSLSTDLPVTPGAFQRTNHAAGVSGANFFTAKFAVGSGPEAYVSPSSIAFASTKVGSTSAYISATLTNNGSATLTGISFSITGTNASSFFLPSNHQGCGATLVAGASCSFDAAFKPTTGGGLSATVQIVDSAGNSPQTVALSGTGVSASTASVSPTSIAFANTKVGSTSAYISATLTNNGSVTLTGISFSITGTNASSFFLPSNHQGCGTTLAAGASCSFDAAFKPTTGGALSANVQITDSASNSPQTVALSGTGIAASTASVSPTSIAFANTKVGSTSAYISATLTNQGATTLTGIVFSITGANASSFFLPSNHQGCGTTLAAGASCSFDAAFKPTTGGALTAAVQIADSAGNSPQTVALSGTGVSPVTASVSPTSIAFATTTVGSTSAYVQATLTNNGTSTLTGIAFSITGTNASSFFLPSNHQGCGTTLAAGASCSFDAAFKPTVTGTLSASVQITDSATNSPQTISLSGTGK